MRRIETRLDTRSRRVPRQRGAQPRRVAAELRAAPASRAARTAGSATSSGWRGRTRCSCATASSCCSIPARRSSSCRRSPPTWTTTARCPAPASSAASASSAGREVIIHADDASVKGGAWYPLSVKKIVRTLDIAIENRLPVIHLCDSAGGFLPLQAELFADRYLCRAHLPQPGDPVEDGRAAGRARARPLHRRRRLHAGAERLQRDRARHRRDLPRRPAAGEGRDRRGRDASTSSAAPTCTRSISGTADYPAANEQQAIAIAREIVGAVRTRPTKADDRAASSPKPPHYDPQELYGIIPRDIKVQFDMREVIARIVDGSRFHEYQPAYGTTLVCGFAHIWGYKVGILANNGVLFNDSVAEGRALHRSSATRTARRCSSCRTSPATWSAASTSIAASPRTAPR